MVEYNKIETVFNRDTTGTKKLIRGDWRNEAVEYLKDSKWQFTEKFDGTNIRVIWDGHYISFAGRTDKATIPQPLMEYLNNTFSTPEVEQLFEQTYGDKQVILFGEGYGPKIQKGGNYREDVSFILFDVLVGENYQERKWVEQTATMLGIDVVPIVLEGTINEAIAFVEGHPKSTMGTAFMEGVVGRPAVELRDRTGKRIIVKIKYEDFRVM